MVFSSFTFLWIFLPLTFFGIWLLRKDHLRNLFLCVLSFIFYAWGEPKYVVLLLFSVSLNWSAGLLYLRPLSEKFRKGILIFTILADLGLLFLFKYSAFFTQTANQLLGGEWIPVKKFALPIGISFYTFQSISYIVDLYRGKIKVQKSWLKLALYISFFPQLVAGPIVQYGDIADELDHRELSLSQTAKGFRRFCYGSAKKVLLANQLGFITDSILSRPMDELSFCLAWAAALTYTLQIYFDFSGYSDMAIGLAGALGFHFQENFNYPYISSSIREFWRRWHISLSSWFRDYLYIPLGGNRRGNARTLINLAVVFLATGLWHGADWTFVLWGVYHGAWSLAERLIPEQIQNKIPAILRRFGTFVIVIVGWVLFRAENLSAAVSQLSLMLGIKSGSGAWDLSEFFTPGLFLLTFVSLLISIIPIPAIIEKTSISPKVLTFIQSVWALICFFLSVILLANAAHNPFIYFRF